MAKRRTERTLNAASSYPQVRPINLLPSVPSIQREPLPPIQTGGGPRMRLRGGSGEGGMADLGRGMENASAAIADAIIRNKEMKREDQRYEDYKQREARNTGIEVLSSMTANATNAMQVAAEAHIFREMQAAQDASDGLTQLESIAKLEDALRMNDWTQATQASMDVETHLAKEMDEIARQARLNDELRMKSEMAAKSSPQPALDAKGRPIKQPQNGGGGASGGSAPVPPAASPASNGAASQGPILPSAKELRDIHDDAMMEIFKAAESTQERDKFDNAQWAGAALSDRFISSMAGAYDFGVDPLSNSGGFLDDEGYWPRFFGGFADKNKAVTDWTPARDMLTMPRDQFMSKVGSNKELFGLHADSGGLVFGSAARAAMLKLAAMNGAPGDIRKEGEAALVSDDQIKGLRNSVYQGVIAQLNRQAEETQSSFNKETNPLAVLKKSAGAGFSNLGNPLGTLVDLKDNVVAYSPTMGTGDRLYNLRNNYEALNALTPREVMSGKVNEKEGDTARVEAAKKGMSILDGVLHDMAGKAAEAHVRSYFGLPGVREAYIKSGIRQETASPSFKSRVQDAVQNGMPAKAAYSRVFKGDRMMGILLSMADSDPRAKSMLEQVRESNPDIFYGYIASKSEDPAMAPYSARLTEIANDDNPSIRADKDRMLGDEITLSLLIDRARTLDDPAFKEAVLKIQQNKLNPNYQSSELSKEDHTRLSAMAKRYIGANWLPKDRREMLGKAYLAQPAYSDAVNRRKQFLENELSVRNARLKDARGTNPVPDMKLPIDDDLKKQLGPYATLFEANMRNVGDAMRSAYGGASPVPSSQPSEPSPTSMTAEETQNPRPSSGSETDTAEGVSY